MRIFSNAFATNMHYSAVVSQGGPACFAKLFRNYLMDHPEQHHWTGVVLHPHHGQNIGLKKILLSPEKDFFLLEVPLKLIRQITQAKKPVDPREILSVPIKKLVVLMKKQHPEVVFLNGFGILNWMLLQAATTNQIPVVIQHAGIWSKELDIHKLLYSRLGRQLMKKMEREATDLAAAEIFLNTWSARYYRKNVTAGQRHRQYVVALPFDFGAFKNIGKVDINPFGLSGDRVNIGFVARWDKIKNHRAVLTMAKHARRKKLPWDFHSVVHIPDNKISEQERWEYERYINVIPPMDRLKIAEFFQAVDIIIVPSIFDVSPTVVLEAVAADTPVVISDQVGYVDEFKAAAAGAWVLKHWSANKAAHQISRLVGRKMPRRLREHLRRQHEHTKVFASYLEIFKQISRAS